MKVLDATEPHIFPPWVMSQGQWDGLGPLLEDYGVSDCTPPDCLDLLKKLMAPSPDLRPTAAMALAHGWIAQPAARAVSPLWIGLADLLESQDVDGYFGMTLKDVIDEEWSLKEDNADVPQTKAQGLDKPPPHDAAISKSARKKAQRRRMKAASKKQQM